MNDSSDEENKEVNSNLKDIPSLDWLKHAGVYFDKQEYPYLKYQTHIIRDKLQQWTKDADDDQIEEAISSIREFMVNGKSLRKLLTIPKNSTKSLIYILLENKELQTQCINMLCQYISLTDMDSSIELPKRNVVDIMRDLKFHSRIFEPEKVTEYIFSCINEAKDVLKPIIIQSLHEVLDCSPTVVNGLLDIMNHTPTLTRDVLSAIEGFDLSQEEKDNIRNKLMQDTLSAVNPTDLNVVVQFLMDTTDKTNAEATVEAFREHLVISSEDSDDGSDMNSFLILILTSSLRFSVDFGNAFLKKMQEELELCTLDVWVLFCMFDITSKRSEAINVINKLAHNQMLDSETIKESIKGHGTALVNISRALTELVAYLLESSQKESVIVGSELAKNLFDETPSMGVQQDILASLLQQVGIGADENKESASKVLDEMSLLYPQKMRKHIQLLESPLFSYMSIPLSIFKSSVNMIVRLTFDSQESIEANAGSQLHVFLRKMLNRTTGDSTKYGVIVAAAILKRYAEISPNDSEPVRKHFNFVLEQIEDDMKAADLLYNELIESRPETAGFSEMLFDNLCDHLSHLLNKDRNEAVERFGVSLENDDEEIDASVNLLDAVTRQVQRRTLTLAHHRDVGGMRIAAYVFCRSALRLYLECGETAGKDIINVARMPLCIFSGTGDDLSKSNTTSILYLAHNWVMQLINHFSKYENRKLAWTRMRQLIEIDDMFVGGIAGEEIDSTETPLMPEFPKLAGINKKAGSSDDHTNYFINELKGYFVSPLPSVLSLLLDIPFPIDENMYRIMGRLLDWYEYLITPPKRRPPGLKSSAIVTPFSVIRISEPPLDVATKLATSVLPDLLTNGHHRAPAAAEQILRILSIQISLPVYKNEQSFNSLLTALCGQPSKKRCFRTFADLIQDNQPPSVRVALIDLIHIILHSGPNARVNQQSGDVAKLNEACRDILKESDPVLPPSLVKHILPLFFEHNPAPLDDVRMFATTALSSDLYKSGSCAQWPSLNEKTSVLFLSQCFAVVNKSIHDVVVLVSKKGETIDEESVLAILKRLTELVDHTRSLLKTTAAEDLPAAVTGACLKYGTSWLAEFTSLFDFLKEAHGVDQSAVNDLMQSVRVVRKYLQSKIKHVRENERTLQRLIPAISKNMHALALCIRNTMLETEGGGSIVLETMHERDLTGQIIPSQQL